MERRITFGLVFLAFFLMAGGAQANPKNIIIMIGDGMGPEQVQAGRLLHPNYDPNYPDREVLTMDALPIRGSVETLNVDFGITDSAASATAYATGCRTENGNISMAEDDLTEFPTSMEAAQDKEMATGILSDVYLCDATPGVWVAHYRRRSCTREEDDGSIGGIIPQQIEACVDVLLGAGEQVAYGPQKGRNARPDYIDGNDPEISSLVENCGYEHVKKTRDFAKAQPSDPSNEGRLLGIWGGYALRYAIDRQNDPGPPPTLADMTAKAIAVLSNEDEYPNGFFLVVEGGHIDWVAHNKDISAVARGVLAFDEAVAVAYDFANGKEGEGPEETLLIVTADHETGGLDLGDAPNVAFIKSVTASNAFMWELIHGEGMSVEDVLSTYAGVDDLTQEEKDAIEAYGEEGIADALNASTRANVKWWLPDGSLSVAPDEGNHTTTEVPVYAYGPGSEALEGDIQNTKIGETLFQAVCPTCAPDCQGFWPKPY
jgi:alkaline phosphatase